MRDEAVNDSMCARCGQIGHITSLCPRGEKRSNDDMTKWIIEARNPDGTLNLRDPQPEAFFGNGAIHGMTDYQIAKVVWRHAPDAELHGDSIATWPRAVDARFLARQKTW